MFASAHRIEPALRALDLDDLPGLQLLDAGAFAGLYHPPLNPDVAALVLPVRAEHLSDLQQVLLNQYPATHALRLVHFSDTGAAAAPALLGELQRAALDGEGALYVPPLAVPSSLERFQDTIAHLRAPEGCPWDRKQTHQSLRPYLLEETYEVLDALDSGDVGALREELGDLLLQIVLHSQIAVDAGEFRMADVIAAIDEKIVRRHPHVWGTTEVQDDQDVKVNWDRLKQVEKQKTRQSRLDGVSKSLPALSQAFSYQDRAARVNFDWDTVEPVIAKLYEEIEEVLTAEDAEARAGEIGDLLFAAVNLARWLDVEPESALRGSNARFYRRFSYIEQEAERQGRTLDEMTLAEMDTLWDQAKANGL